MKRLHVSAALALSTAIIATLGGCGSTSSGAADAPRPRAMAPVDPPAATATPARNAVTVSEDKMRAAMQAYIDLFNAKDGEGLAALFADDARIEDPVGGSRIVEGRVAIDAFYRGAVEVVDRLELAAPIRTSYGNSAAMPFDIHMSRDGRPFLIRAIDVMTFNAEGKIIDMRAYHGPGDAGFVDERRALGVAGGPSDLGAVPDPHRVK